MVILEILSRYHWKPLRSKQPFPGRQKPPSHRWFMERQWAAKPYGGASSRAHAGLTCKLFFSGKKKKKVILSVANFRDEKYILPWFRELQSLFYLHSHLRPQWNIRYYGPDVLMPCEVQFSWLKTATLGGHQSPVDLVAYRLAFCG